MFQTVFVMLVMLDDQNPFTAISEEIDSVHLSDMHCISSEDLYATPRWLDIQRICRELIVEPLDYLVQFGVYA